MEWKFARSKIQGRSHEKSDPIIVCQDSYYPENTEDLQKNGIYAIVLADGAGSASCAHFGSAMTVRTVSDFLCNEDNFEALYNAPYKEAEDIKNRLRNEIIEKLDLEKERLSAECPDLSIKSLASTLLFVAIREDRYVIGHIGDGFIAALYENAEGRISAEPVHNVGMPENGRFVNETYFVTDDNMTDHLRLSSGNLETDKGSITSFALMSDGTADVLWMKKERKFRDGLDVLMSKVFKNNEEMQKEIDCNLLPKIKQVTSDDCSIIIISREYRKNKISAEDDDETLFETKEETSSEQDSETKKEMAAEPKEESTETLKTETTENNI